MEDYDDAYMDNNYLRDLEGDIELSDDDSDHDSIISSLIFDADDGDVFIEHDEDYGIEPDVYDIDSDNGIEPDLDGIEPDVYDTDSDIGIEPDDYDGDSVDEVMADDTSSLDSNEDAMSEASFVHDENEQQQQQPSQSGTDTEVEPDEPADEENIVQSQKKIKLDVSTSKEIKTLVNDSFDDDQKCPICLEIWSNAGEHRLCSLRCGHLFGLKCIEQWFSIAQNATARKCPECNAKASKKDIRILYAKNLKSIDTVELEKVKQELKETTYKKEKAERDLKQYKDKEVLYEQQLASFRKRIVELERTVKTITSERTNFSLQYDNISLKKNKVFDICNNNSCRVLAYNPWNQILVASSGNAISRIFMDTLSASSNVNIHSGPVRDVAFQEQHPNFLLSVGFDKKVILTDIRSNLLTHSYQTDTNLWSCCWSNYCNEILFVGGARGNIIEYDIRYLQTSISTKLNNEDRTPVVSLASVPTSSPALRAGGYLACQLNSCYAYSCKEGNYVGNQIGIEGPFTSLRYNDKDNHVLLSCRANSKNPFIRHLVCSIEKSEDKIKFNTVHSFNAGSSQKLLSRPCYMNLQNDTMVIANNENLSKIVAWSISTGQEAYSIPISESVVDVCSFEIDGIHQAVLTSNKLHLYQHKDTSV